MVWGVLVFAYLACVALAARGAAGRPILLAAACVAGLSYTAVALVVLAVLRRRARRLREIGTLLRLAYLVDFTQHEQVLRRAVAVGGVLTMIALCLAALYVI
jgi:hypothetical protein